MRIRKREGKIWTPPVATKVAGTPRSYLVEAEGVRFLTNRRDQNKTVERTDRKSN